MNDAVVVGYDQSQSGDHTLAEAARAALRWGAPLVALNVPLRSSHTARRHNDDPAPSRSSPEADGRAA